MLDLFPTKNNLSSTPELNAAIAVQLTAPSAAREMVMVAAANVLRQVSSEDLSGEAAIAVECLAVAIAALSPTDKKFVEQSVNEVYGSERV